MKKMLCFYFVLALNQPALFCMRKQISPRGQNEQRKPERKVGMPNLLQKLSPPKKAVRKNVSRENEVVPSKKGMISPRRLPQKVQINSENLKSSQESPIYALLDAISSQNISEIKRMLDSDVDINQRTLEGKTALTTAIFSGNAEVVEFLIDNGADVRPTNSNPMQVAKLMNNEKIIAILNRECQREDVIEELVNVIGAQEIDSQKIDSLLAGRIEINRCTREGKTALIAAIFSGNVKLVERLIQKGADMNPKTTNPLQVAYLTQNKEIINLLQEHGAIDEAHSTIDDASLRKKKAHSCDCEKCADALAKEIEGYASQRLPLLSIDMGSDPQQVAKMREILDQKKLEKSERRAKEAALKRKERQFELTIGVDSPPQSHQVMPWGTIDDVGREPVNIFDMMMKQKMK